MKWLGFGIKRSKVKVPAQCCASIRLYIFVVFRLSAAKIQKSIAPHCCFIGHASTGTLILVLLMVKDVCLML